MHGARKRIEVRKEFDSMIQRKCSKYGCRDWTPAFLHVAMSVDPSFL